MKLRLLVLSSLATCALVVACSGGEPELAPAGGDGADGGAATTTTPPPEGTSAPVVDSGAPPGEEDAGLITQGGGDPDVEPDAGVVDAAAPADAGICGPASGNGAVVASACSSSLVFVAGGAITPGSYDLAGFTVTGSLAFCSTYTAGNYAGRLDIAADGVGGFTFGERIVKSGGLSLFPNRSFSATISNTSLEVTQTCGPSITSTKWGYSVTTTAGKPTLIYTHALGSAIVRYRWVMR